MKKYNIHSEDLGIFYQDEGPWRSFSLDTHGDNVTELIEDATISEIDQDGGELDSYGLDECSPQIEEAVLNLIEETILRTDAQIAKNLEEQKMKGND